MAITNARNGYLNGTTDGWVARSLFPVGNTWYAVVLNTTAVLIEVHKSTDGGVTWVEQDSANSRGHSGATHSYDAGMAIGGTLIHVAYRTATNTVRVRTFNTATDTWAASDVGAADATTVASAVFNLRVAVRTDGDVLLLYKNSSTAACGYTRYEGVSWTAVALVAAAHPLDLIMTGNSDMAHLFMLDTATKVWQRSLDNTNVLGTNTQAGDATTTLTFSGFHGYVNDAGTHRVAELDRDSTGDSDFYYGTSAATITFTAVTTVIPATTTDMGILGGTISPYNSKWYLVWSGDARGSIHMDVSDDFATPAFGTDTNVVTGLTNDPAVYATNSANGVGVLYTDLTTPFVEFIFAVGSHPASGGRIMTRSRVSRNTNLRT